MSQKQQVLEYLQKGYSLTPKEAMKKFGSMRLGALIFDLWAEGYDIVNVQHKVVYPEGCGVNTGMKKHKTRYGEYILIDSHKELAKMVEHLEEVNGRVGF